METKSKKKILTRKQLLASRVKDYMNEEQLDFFRAELNRLRDETMDGIGDAQKELGSSKNQEIDELDQAFIEEQNRMRTRFVERKNRLLIKINDALRRVHGQGDKPFGYCERTGERIGLERLLARPTATLCIEEKLRDEKQERNYFKDRSESKNT